MNNKIENSLDNLTPIGAYELGLRHGRIEAISDFENADRVVHYIDVSEMSERDVCMFLGIKYIPWYRDIMFYCLVLFFISLSNLFAFSIIN